MGVGQREPVRHRGGFYYATATEDTGLVLLEGSPSVYSVDFTSMVIDDAAPTVPAPASGQIGGVTLQGIDWFRVGPTAYLKGREPSRFGSSDSAFENTTETAPGWKHQFSSTKSEVNL